MGLNSKDHLFFVQNFQEIDVCGSKMYQFTGSDYSQSTDFTRLTYDHNLDTCESCRKNHATTLSEITERFNRFPTCCVPHSRLLNEKWFNLKDFDNTPRLYTDKLYYTWHHVLHFIEKDNWRDEIFDFIEYILNTFGSFPIDYGEPLYFSAFIHQLKSLIKKGLQDHQSKSDEIIEFISQYGNPKANKRTDFNILISIYNEWYKTFPFELSFFTHLKAHFAAHIPIIEEMHTNKYLGLTKARLLSKERLVEFLVQATEVIISEINTMALYEQGLISDIDQMELELIVQERKQKLKAGYRNASKNAETRYRKILKAWLKDEINFIQKIRPVAERISTKQEKLHESVLSACFKMQENKIFWNADENTRTKQILDLLSGNFFTKDQSQYGESETGKKQGSVDGVILDTNSTEHFIEAFNLIGLNRDVIQRHIHKLESNYDAKGLPNKYVLVYCNVEDGTFEKLYKDYLDFIKTEMQFKFETIEVSEIATKYSNIREIKSLHKREARDVALCHLLIKMPVK